MIKSLYINLISLNYLNKIISINGWIENIRNHGDLCFLILKEKTCILQILIKNLNIKKLLMSLKQGSCVFIRGILVLREDFCFNFFIKTGNIEIYCYDIFLINKSNIIAFNINDYNLSNSLKLLDRFLYLRGILMQNNIKFKYNLIKYVRNFLNKEFFLDIETPFLSKSTPEGSRDFLIPSRLNLFKFFSLPQSPQLFKQIFMISFFDKYYQIVRCFRDEDLRKNRQFEFNQIDCELSFINQFDVIFIFTNMILFLFLFFINYNNLLFLYISYNECLKLLLSDKPDLRLNINYYNFFNFSKFKYFLNKNFFKFIVIDLDFYDLFGNDFKNFYFFIKKNFIISYFLFYKNYKYCNICIFENFYLKKIKNFIFEIKSYFILNKEFNILFIFYFNFNFLNLFLLLLYNFCFSNFGLLNNLIIYKFLPVWILNFPLFLYDNLIEKYVYAHNPFSSPLNFDILYLDFSPLNVISKSYDLVINGDEMGGGSIRNDKIYIQKRIFFILNISFWEINFNFFFKSLKFAPPPHGGIALGLERFLMLFLSPRCIKNVVPFPKTKNGVCLFTNSPNYINW